MVTTGGTGVTGVGPSPRASAHPIPIIIKRAGIPQSRRFITGETPDTLPPLFKYLASGRRTLAKPPKCVKISPHFKTRLGSLHPGPQFAYSPLHGATPSRFGSKPSRSPPFPL